jgi:hypothetical protein
MLTEYVHDQVHELNRERRTLALSRPRYDRASEYGYGRVRGLLRRIALSPARVTPDDRGHVPAVHIRPASPTDARALARLAAASERRLPSGVVLVAEVESKVVAAVPVDGDYVLADLWRPTSDVVQLLELRSGQLRAGRVDLAA